MSVAPEAIRSDTERVPGGVSVKDNDGSTTKYVRNQKAPRPDGDADLKYDEFHRDQIALGTKGGKTILQQQGKGLPARIVMSMFLQPSAAVAGGWEPSEYLYFDK